MKANFDVKEMHTMRRNGDRNTTLPSKCTRVSYKCIEEQIHARREQQGSEYRIRAGSRRRDKTPGRQTKAMESNSVTTVLALR